MNVFSRNSARQTSTEVQFPSLLWYVHMQPHTQVFATTLPAWSQPPDLNSLEGSTNPPNIAGIAEGGSQKNEIQGQVSED